MLKRMGRVSGKLPASVAFAATVTALEALAQALQAAQSARTAPSDDPQGALVALLLPRQVREQLAGWEPGLIEAARQAGASWADLAHPLGVSRRQAAERPYLRVRPVRRAPSRNSGCRPLAVGARQTAP